MALHGASSRHALCFGLYCADTEVSCSSSPTEHAVKPVAVLVMALLWHTGVCQRDVRVGDGWVSAEALADDPRTSAKGCRRACWRDEGWVSAEAPADGRDGRLLQPTLQR